MGITSQRLFELGMVDQVIQEPLGGAHRDVDLMATRLKAALIENLALLDKMPADQLVETRFKKYMRFGRYKVA